MTNSVCGGGVEALALPPQERRRGGCGGGGRGGGGARAAPGRRRRRPARRRRRRALHLQGHFVGRRVAQDRQGVLQDDVLEVDPDAVDSVT